MPRGERPLESADGVLAEFARDLRLLREKAGSPTYRELSTRAHYSAAALSEAAGGRKLPSLPVTVAYVAACGGDAADWENRWRTTAAELAAAKTDEAGGGADGSRAPYVGLAAFQQEDVDRFFGRDKLVADLMTRLRQRRFIGVFGSSGCGKSSALRAGLAARLSAEQKEDSGPVVVFTPGQHPMEECAVQLARFLDESPGKLRDEFSADPRNLHLRIRQAVANAQAKSDVVLVVDQFEELFTLCGDEEERAGFVEALVIAATEPASRTRVALAVRADFLGHCGRYPSLVTALQDAHVLVGAMPTDDLRLAITGPAEHMGYRVETALVARLVADATRQPGMLPLVSHALLQTWLRRQGTAMTLAGYEAVGGIEHALARSAEEIYLSLDSDQQDIAKHVFLRLTALGEGTEDTKRRIARDELDRDDPEMARTLDVLTRARLLTVGHDSVEIAHEALIRHWPRLRDWLAEDRDGHRVHRQLTEAATEWERHEHDDGLLFRGARLAVWQDRSLDRLNGTERTFLEASRLAVDQEHRLRRRRVRMTMGGLASATAIITVLAVLALVMAVRAEDERALAVGRQLVADARAQLQIDPELALLLAREAFTRTPNDDTEAILRQAFVGSRVRATLPGDKDGVTGIAFSPDGRHLATSNMDATLRLWDWDGDHVNGTEPQVFGNLGMSGPVFSSGGRGIAATSTDGALAVQEWPGDAEPVVLPEHETGMMGLTFSADGQYVASSAFGGDILVSNVSGNGRPKVLAGHDDVLGMGFSPDGRLLASGEMDGAIRIWDLVGGGAPIVLTGHLGPVNAVAFSPDGRQVASVGADGTVRNWDATGGSGSVLLGRHGGSVRSVAYSPDGHWIASAGQDPAVRVWSVDHPANPVVLRGHDAAVRAVAFSPDGKFVASASDDGTAKVWAVDEVDDLMVLRGHHGRVRSVAAGSDGRQVASGGQDGTVRIWDLASNRDSRTLHQQAGPITQVTFSPDGRRVNSVEGVGLICAWTTTKPAGPEQSPDCREPESGIERVAFSPDGNRFAIANESGTMELWSTTWPRGPETLPGSQEAVTSIAWSPTGHHIAASTRNGSVLLWDVRSPVEPTRLSGQPGQIQSLTFSLDGTHLASGSNDGTVHVWNIADTAKPFVLPGHQGGVWSVTFSRDGRNLITSSDDATIRVWKTDSTSAPLVLGGFHASTREVAVLPDGSYVTAHDDGAVRVWRCHACGPITEVLADVGQHVTRELTPQERQTYL